MGKTLRSYTILITSCCLLFSIACSDNVEVIEKSYYSGSEYRALTSMLNLPPSLHNYNGNKTPGNISPKATLGRVLFYDKNLSADKTISCASCHLQKKAFADDVAFSIGIHNRLTTRNSITIAAVPDFEEHYGISSMSAPQFFWDERAATLIDQMIETLENPLEMGMPVEDIPDILSDKKHYKILFEKAYATTDIESHMVLDALAAFVNSIRTTNSKFDIANEKSGSTSLHQNFTRFTTQENLGKSIFLKNCSSCHGFSLNTPSSTSASFFTSSPISIANNGLEMEYVDKGKASHTNKAEDIGVFKIPGLRNIELSGPYMHDGRFETLEEVVDFYSEQIQDHPNLNYRLKNNDGTPKRMHFGTWEKEALIAFLKTLTGSNVTQEEKWSDPFKK